MAVLSRDAEETLFASAERISEGEIRDASYFGSTMITISLATLGRRWRGRLSDEVLAELVHILEGSVRVRLRAMRLACADVAHRFPDVSLGTARVETQIVLAPGELHLDVDIEVPLEQASAGSHHASE